MDGEIWLVLDSLLDYVSSSPPPDRISGDTLFWTITQLTYDSGNVVIPVTIRPDSFAVDGQEVCMDLGVTEVFGDANLYNNLVNHCENLVNSYDPNDIRVYPRGACEEGFVELGQPLTYFIRFQNTGSAPAINIRVEDELPDGLDISTVNILSHSHPGLVTELGPGNLIRFIHDGINLPDSTNNEPESHGFIVFEVRPLADLAADHTVTNRAEIYFDFNPPVITNEVSNTFVAEIPSCDPIQDMGEEVDPAEIEMTLYPNPGDGTYFLAVGSEQPLENVSLRVYAVSGKLVLEKEVPSLRMEEITLEQPNGIYFLRVSSGSLERTFKILNRK